MDQDIILLVVLIAVVAIDGYFYVQYRHRNNIKTGQNNKNKPIHRAGRPRGAKNRRYPKREVVLQWKADHPGASQRACARETGINRETVAKWWRTDDEESDPRG